MTRSHERIGAADERSSHRRVGPQVDGGDDGGLPRGDVGALVIAAADGDRGAWERLVVGYSDLVSSITDAHRLNAIDSARVRAAVWRRLDRNLGKIRQPDRVGAWLGAVARDECVKALTTSARAAA